MKKYFTIWLKSTIVYLQINLVNRSSMLLLTLGKFLRFFFFLAFLFITLGKTQSLGGYSLWGVIFIFATFNLIDITPQLLFRSVYRFRSLVVSGDFDLFLLQPISPLFRALLGSSDSLDIPMVFLSIGFILYSGLHLNNVGISGVFLYVFLVLNAMIIALAFHILIISIGVVSTEVDSTVMLYRDLTQMGRVPITVYQEGVSFLLTFVVPIGIMMTFPVKALMGTLSAVFILYSFSFGVIFLTFALTMWRNSLKSYSSASS